MRLETVRYRGQGVNDPTDYEYTEIYFDDTATLRRPDMRDFELHSPIRLPESGRSRLFSSFLHRNAVFDAFMWKLRYHNNIEIYPTSVLLPSLRSDAQESLVAMNAVVSKTIEFQGAEPQKGRKGTYTVQINPQTNLPNGWIFETEDRTSKWTFRAEKWAKADDPADKCHYYYPSHTKMSFFWSPDAPGNYVECIKWETKIEDFRILDSVSKEEFLKKKYPPKRLWAKSVLNQKSPEMAVASWLTPEPKPAGKFVLIEFWATTCFHCKEAHSLLDSLQKKFPDDLAVIAISDEEASVVQSFLRDHPPGYAVAIDPGNRMARQLDVTGIPHALLVDPDGIVRWEGYPLLEGYELTEQIVADALEQYSRNSDNSLTSRRNGTP